MGVARTQRLKFRKNTLFRVQRHNTEHISSTADDELAHKVDGRWAQKASQDVLKVRYHSHHQVERVPSRSQAQGNTV